MNLIRSYNLFARSFAALTVLSIMMTAANAQITVTNQQYLFTPQQTINLTLHIEHALTQEADVPLYGNLAAYGMTDGQMLSRTLHLVPGQPITCELQWPVQALGLYTLSLHLGDSPSFLAEKRLNLGVLPQAMPCSNNPASAFGAVAHLNRMNQEQLLTTVQHMASIGIRWAREGFIWSDIQPTPDNMKWDRYDRLMDICEQYGISVLPVMAYGTKWAAQQPPKDIDSPDQRSEALPRLDAWQHFIHATVDRYKNRIHHWEIWNEPNSTTFLKIEDRTQQAKAYAGLLATAYEVIKQTDPKANVISGGFTPKHWIPKTPYLHEAVFMKAIYEQLPRPFDILGYHPYTAPHTDTSNQLTVNKYFKLASFCWDVCIQQENKLPETWMTEMGTPTMPFMTEDRAAQYMVVLYVAAMADQRVSKNFWYDFQNDGQDTANKEHNFGLLRFDGSPKPGYFAYLNLTTQLEGAVFVESEIKPDWTMHQFSKNGKQIKVLWTNQDEHVLITLPTSPSPYTVLNVLGQKMPLQSTDGKLNLTVSQSPTFVIQ